MTRASVPRGGARGSGGRWGSQDGFLGGLDALAFGALVFVTGTLLVLNAWSVVDTRMAVGAAAREAARTVAAVPLQPGGALPDLAHLEVEAGQAALTALAQHGLDVTGLVGTDVATFSALDPAALRCARVVATVTFEAPTIGLPFVGVFRRGGIPVTVTHTERVDPFRSGLTGEATCA